MITYVLRDIYSHNYVTAGGMRSANKMNALQFDAAQVQRILGQSGRKTVYVEVLGEINIDTNDSVRM